MNTTIILTVLAVGLLAGAAIFAAAPAPSTVAPGQPLAAICQKHELPALAVVVVKDGTICDRVATGVRKWGDPTPVTTNDV